MDDSKNHIIDSILGELSEEEDSSLQDQLKLDKSLEKDYQETKLVISRLQELAVEPSFGSDIIEPVVERINKRISFFERYLTFNISNRFLAVASVVTVAFLMFSNIISTNNTKIPSSGNNSTGNFSSGTGYSSGGSYGYSPRASYNDMRITDNVDVVLNYINGTFGALCMIVSFLVGIILLSLGINKKQRRVIVAGVVFIIMGVAVFLLRDLASTWIIDYSPYTHTHS